MWLYNQSSRTSRMALTYITVGALTVIWAGVWFVALYNSPPDTRTAYYWSAGFIVTGLMLVFLGVGVGWLGQPTQLATLPSEGVPIAAPSPPIVPAAVLTAPKPNGILVATDGRVVGASPHLR